MSDTIFALATARGKSGIAVIRISGPEAVAAARALGVGAIEPRKAVLRTLRTRGEALDEAVVIFFEKGSSFTGEDVVELQVHGSLAVVSRLVDDLVQIEGLRPAVAGEFTRRALENGCLDLTQVEGLADLIEAETEAQRKQALRVMSGAIGNRAREWRQYIVRAAALIEASIDFVDEDVPVDVLPEVREITQRLVRELRQEIDGFQAAERIRDGFEIAIIGAPNVGKSSLLNALAGRDVAITSAVAGTTRDIIEVRMDLRGLPVTFLDTAGLRETEDDVEKQGVERAKKRAAGADLRILVRSPDQTDVPEQGLAVDIEVWSKADVYPDVGTVSSKTGRGLEELLESVYSHLQKRASGAGLLIRARQRRALQSAVAALETALIVSDHSDPRLEEIAAELRSAGRGLEIMVGKIDVESLLDEIFSSFCIGK